MTNGHGHNGNGNGRRVTADTPVSISLGAVPPHIRAMFDEAVTAEQNGWVKHARATDALLQARVMPKAAAFFAANALGRTRGSTARCRHNLWQAVGDDLLIEFHFFSETDWRLIRSGAAKREIPISEAVGQILATSDDYGGELMPTDAVAVWSGGEKLPDADKYGTALERMERAGLSALRACPGDRVDTLNVILSALQDEREAWGRKTQGEAVT